MIEVTAYWRKYPDEKPTEPGWYWVIVDNERRTGSWSPRDPWNVDYWLEVPDPPKPIEPGTWCRFWDKARDEYLIRPIHGEDAGGGYMDIYGMVWSHAEPLEPELIEKWGLEE